MNGIDGTSTKQRLPKVIAAMNEQQRTFLTAKSFAVAGASNDREKYGNIVLRKLLSTGRTVVPINPKADLIEGLAAFASVVDVVPVPESLSIVTPTEITLAIVRDAIRVGVKNIWMQPGAENDQASVEARAAGLNVIDDGSCVLVALSLEKTHPQP